MLDTPIHKTQDKDKQNKNTTQYVLDTPIHKKQDKDKQNKNTTQYLLDTPIHKTLDKDKQNTNTTQYVLDPLYTRHKTKTNKIKTLHNMCWTPLNTTNPK